MSNSPGRPTPTAVDSGQAELRQGLIDFYHTQAEVMLAQYKNIEQLLGDTDDWTAPGTHCEILLRNLLRQFLPAYYKAEKGFIYGRLRAGNKSKHCPEIDILIHDAHNFRPVFQLEDFVIVQAKATHGALQIKRRMDTDKLREGIDNAMAAREHFHWLCGGTGRSPDTKFFSAVLFFDERSPRQDGKASGTYSSVITEKLSSRETWHLAPDLIGSLRGHLFRRDKTDPSRLRYDGFPANVGGRNIAVQIVLTLLHEAVGQAGTGLPFPPGNVPAVNVTTIQIPAQQSPPAAASTAPTKDAGGATE